MNVYVPFCLPQICIGAGAKEPKKGPDASGPIKLPIGDGGVSINLLCYSRWAGQVMVKGSGG